MKLTKFLIAGGFALASFGANAALTFDNEGDGGTLSYATGGNLIGSGILFDSITATNTNNNGSTNCIGCQLNFESGELLDLSLIYGTTIAYAFAGGDFTLTGGHIESGVGSDTSTILAAGTFLSPMVVTITPDVGYSFSFAAGPDEKNSTLVSYYHDPAPASWMAGLTITGDAAGWADRGNFNMAVLDADFTNTEVPIPAAAWLFGSGLIGLAGIARRKKAAA